MIDSIKDSIKDEVITMTKIVAYTTQTCTYCKQAKEFLRDKGYTFEERDVNTDPKANSEFQTLKLTGVPAFLVGDQLVVGFDPQRIEALLDYFVAPCPACNTRYKFPKNKGKLRVTCKACAHQYELVSDNK